jgi:hypothetical protein
MADFKDEFSSRRDAGTGLDPLALLQRVRHIAAALVHALPEAFTDGRPVRSKGRTRSSSR